MLADDPMTPPVSVEVLAGDLPPGASSTGAFGSGPPMAEVLCGAYDIASQGSLVLRDLPNYILVLTEEHRGTMLGQILELLTMEFRHPKSGARLMQSHLVDMVLVEALRLWSVRPGVNAGWIGALNDPSIGLSLRAIHADPAANWSVGGLAALAGQSRAVFARRFRDSVGEPPLTYIARLRMAEAARRLTEGALIAEAAEVAGYANEFAFAKAFKRIRGEAPGQLRRRHAQQRLSSSLIHPIHEVAASRRHEHAARGRARRSCRARPPH
jgi:AraC-like DNA-binding protein